MRVLIIGSGGREHALAWKMRQSSRVREVLCLPGNAGIAKDARTIRLPLLSASAVSDLVRKEKIDIVVIGPEAPLAGGMSDQLKEDGIPVVGPVREAAKLESSKVFAKEFMDRHGIPTARFTVHNSAEDALKRLNSRETHYPLVVKADGLAAGKGVVVAQTPAQAREAVNRMMVEREFGDAGNTIVLEDFLEGSEASFIVFTDGSTIVPAVAARDHKAAYDNDRGPNTGGMGAYSTDGILGPELENQIMKRIVGPAVEGMRDEGTPFQGMLYAGLMLCSGQPYVLEFNVRMGDPEGQVILPRLESDFADLCEALCQGRLDQYDASWRHCAAVCVVLASGGYPGSYTKGKVISGLGLAEEDSRITVFHSGTRRTGEDYVTDGGRVLGVTAVGANLASAVTTAYEAVSKIHFDGMHYRTDIGAKGLQSIMHQE